MCKLLVFRNLLQVALIGLGQIESYFIVLLGHLCESLPPLLRLFVLLIQEDLFFHFKAFLLLLEGFQLCLELPNFNLR